MKHRIFLVLGMVIVAGCSTLLTTNWDQLYGKSNPARYDTPTAPLHDGDVSYLDDVKPILDQRCVVCHACYDSPCQLKLGSYAGITRGASKTQVYDDRVLAGDPTRLFQDATSTAQWRTKDFFPVLNERKNIPAANISVSVLAQLLLQKQQFPLPHQDQLPDSFDFRLYRDQECPKPEEVTHYQQKHPLWGMPYGLPAISKQHSDTILSWLAQGAVGKENVRTTPALQAKIVKWEAFLNQNSIKAQVVSRYIYEHLFLASLYFNDSSNPVYYELIRSSTPPGQPINRISTRRPYDDPEVDRVYYRLQERLETPVLKTHMPYRLNEARMDKWQTWFFNDDYEVTAIPSYKIKDASNPFLTFRELPSKSRYRFMLDEAQFTIMGFIKGPVCRGSLALNVINDHFWVVFVDPEQQPEIFSDQFILDHVNNLQLPAEATSSAGVLNWISYARGERNYFDAMVKTINHKMEAGFKIDLDLVWDGDGNNDNAALTIYRHLDSASVIKGLHGDKPQTAWVISYPLLERIHYLLVAGYDVYGNIGHNFNTRVYMDFLRMEGEFNFLTLLPLGERYKVRNVWYRGSVESVKERIFESAGTYQGQSSVVYNTDSPLDELYLKLQQRLAPVMNHVHDADQGHLHGDAQQAIHDLDAIAGIAASKMPQVAMLEITETDKNQSLYYTILSNSAFTNISHIFDEQDRRLPEEDDLTVGYGIISAHPHVFLRVPRNKLREFATQVSRLATDQDYTQLLDQYAVRRSSPQFWQYSDRLHSYNFDQWPIEFALLDYSRMENK